MAPKFEQQAEPFRGGIRIAATSVMWALGTGMLAICIPLVKVTQSGPLLPVAVVTAITISTVAVWFSPGGRSRNSSALAESVEVLEQRLNSLEGVSSADELTENQVQQLEPGSVEEPEKG
ncbi:MHYT domain-containing protein [Leptolyngbya sp. FACHB-261]|uniref:MHYT domain-containing protein n=1 Tax=Leptolyngbya sp. FACHB-261 TaxID=2692806 RepID=UPI0016832664|nr:MHYT domain-containing protein [Leptolyngbya sp. FACHB-261]MBD2104366.1 hypothetical protein [Leptolyngbya sp. FACHB-261]